MVLIRVVGMDIGKILGKWGGISGIHGWYGLIPFPERLGTTMEEYADILEKIGGELKPLVFSWGAKIIFLGRWNALSNVDEWS